MKNGRSTWDDVRQISDELQLQLHLATLEARDRWKAIQPELAELEQLVTESGKSAGAAVERKLTSVLDALRRLRDDVVKSLKN